MGVYVNFRVISGETVTQGLPWIAPIAIVRIPFRNLLKVQGVAFSLQDVKISAQPSRRHPYITYQMEENDGSPGLCGKACRAFAKTVQGGRLRYDAVRFILQRKSHTLDPYLQSEHRYGNGYLAGSVYRRAPMMARSTPGCVWDRQKWLTKSVYLT